MVCFGFESWSAVYVYFTCFMCGIAALFTIGAVSAAPSYILFFYKYASKDPNAYPEVPNTATDTRYPNFWQNVMTYQNFIGFIMSLIWEPLTLSEFFGRISAFYRMLAGFSIFMVEVIVLLAVPAAGTSEGGAIATLVVCAVISGTGKGILEASIYGTFNAFPPRFTTALICGCGVAGVIASILQVIVRASIPDDVRLQAKIFYSLAIGVQALSFLSVIGLRFNSYAQRYGSCFRPASWVGPDNAIEMDAAGEPYSDGLGEATCGPAAGRVADDDALEASSGSPARKLKEDPAAAGVDDDEGETVRAVRLSETSDGLAAAINSNPDANACGVFKIIYPLWGASVFVFYITLMLYPTIIINMNPTDFWYPTLIVLAFNVTDMLGRFTPTWRGMWPSSGWVVVAGSAARVLFIPLFMVASYRYVTHYAYAYIIVIVFGYTNGVVGSLAMLLASNNRRIIGEKMRVLSGNMMGVSILVGGCLGAVFAIIIETVRQNKAA